MACLSQLDQDQEAKQQVGRDVRTGVSKVFQTLDQQTMQTKALSNQGIQCPEVSFPKVREVKKLPPDSSQQESGFMEFSARDPATQAKASAMSPSWDGVEASEQAISKGLQDLDTVLPYKKDTRKGK